MSKENFKTKYKVEFSGAILGLWILGWILSIMIGFKIMAFGFFNVIVYLMISSAMSVFVMPMLSGLVKACRTNLHVYAEAGIRLGFYMLIRQLDVLSTAPKTVYMYMGGYFLVWSIVDLVISFISC